MNFLLSNKIVYIFQIKNIDIKPYLIKFIYTIKTLKFLFNNILANLFLIMTFNYQVFDKALKMM